MKRYLPYIHPFLFAIYPVLFLYSQNIFEYTEGSLIVPLVFSLLFASIVFLITKLVLKDLGKSAIVSSYIIFMSLSFGRIPGIVGIKNLTIADYLIDRKVIIALILFAVLFLIFKAFKRFPESIPSINQYLVILSTILLIFAFIPIVNFEAKTQRIFKAPPQESSQTTNSERQTSDSKLPDVYYFIFDRYAGPKSLESEYNVDNSKLFDFLSEKGFYIAKDSSTNYPKTFLSLASSLNMEYLDALTAKTNGGSSPDESLGTPLIRNSKVLNFLKSKGYYTVNIGSPAWGPTSKNPYADRNFIMQKSTYPLVDAFGTGFLNMTAAEPVFKIIFKSPADVSEDPYNNEHRRIALYELSAIDEAIKIPGPKFVFTHILLPHDPFVFDKDCTPVSEGEVGKHDHVYNYMQQLQCVNTHVERIISNILKSSKTPPIIVLQSDEGPFPMKVPIPPKQGWGTAKDESLREKFPILNAYYFPDKNYEGLYQSITPVNSWKVVLNSNFGTDYPLVEDRNYVFYDKDNFYKFTDVTNRIK